VALQRSGGQPLRDAAEISFWLSDAGDLTPRPCLPGDTDTDVVIVGAGYTGLWTALYLAERDPSLRIIVCEAHIAGFGASGRNGGWCVANLGVTPSELARRYGRDALWRTWAALDATVDEVGAATARAGIDAGWHKSGALRIARGAHELPALQEAWRARQELGLDDGCELLDAAQLTRRVRVAGGLGALFDPACAVVHPGRLVRGLADAAEARGARVHEQTPVIRITPGDTGRRPRVFTPHGAVTADVVVLAGEAYLTQLPGLRRRLLPVYSLIVMTEPLSSAQLDAIGWEGRECLSSHRLTVDYVARTADDRIVFGGRGAPYHLGSAIAPEFDRHGPTHQRLRQSLVEWFPALEGIGFTHEWGGPLGMPRDWLPTFSLNRATGIGGAFGYTGQGVAAANLAGRTLTDLITDTPSPLRELPMVGHRSRRWEPEPLRWIAARYLQGALARIDERGQRTGRAPTGRSLAERLIRH
jgi:glycine/D-amino acid oxidase-like deaminating enzyme